MDKNYLLNLNKLNEIIYNKFKSQLGNFYEVLFDINIK